SCHPTQLGSYLLRVTVSDSLGDMGSSVANLTVTSCRETDIEVLKARLEKQGAKMENYDWYLDLRRYGSVPHSGFGLGVERVVRWICKREHIRDTTPFPRTPSRVTP
ncbi:MAG: hypothetical protein M1144_05315, partial [Candidatus Thermoplasmatota archaeon]|nr:hypothetical protein [Candidatus Thermoplasmatota archaeon]